MAAGGGESPDPPQSSWGGGPRPPTRALTCAVRCGALSGRCAAPRRAALPLRAPPRGVAGVGGVSEEAGRGPGMSPSQQLSPRASPTRLRKLPSGPRASHDRTLAVFSPLTSFSRSEDRRQCLSHPDFLTHPLSPGCCSETLPTPVARSPGSPPSPPAHPRRSPG